jgi:hypothetical protein
MRGRGGPVGGRSSPSSPLRAHTSKKRARSPSVEKERGWDSRVKASSNLPSYDPTSDRHCTYTKSKKFKTLQMKMDRLSSERESRSTSPVKEISTLQVMKTTKHLAQSSGGSDNSLRSISTATGGATWQSDDSRDPTSELEVLKCIILRESYLSRMVEMSKSQDVLKSDLIDLIDLHRIITVETIETIIRWRKAQIRPHPFIWNGINYLLKVGVIFEASDQQQHP